MDADRQLCEYAYMLNWHRGDVIRKIRLNREMTIADLVRLSGVDKGTISMVERGDRVPREGTVSKLAAALGMTVAEIYGLVPCETVPESQRDQNGPQGKLHVILGSEYAASCIDCLEGMYCLAVEERARARPKKMAGSRREP